MEEPRGIPPYLYVGGVDEDDADDGDERTNASHAMVERTLPSHELRDEKSQSECCQQPNYYPVSGHGYPPGIRVYSMVKICQNAGRNVYQILQELPRIFYHRTRGF